MERPAVREEEPKVMMLNPQGGRVPRKRDPPITTMVHADLGLDVKERHQGRKKEREREAAALLRGAEKRRAAIVEERRRSQAAQRERLRRKFYVGLQSPEERKRLFLHYFGDGAQSERPLTPEEFLEGPLHTLEPAVENPYDKESWPTTAQLERLSVERPPKLDQVASLFTSRYAVLNKIPQEQQTSTKPDLYNLLSVSHYFRHILAERDDLFLKVVPISGIHPEALREVYNEIIAGYFLQELVYAYSQVLSLHFMNIIDWFPAVRTAIVPEEGPNQFYHQVIVSERLDHSLGDYLEKNPSIGVLRATLFQLYHALETAWHTNQYTHNDLHLKNVMVQVVPAESPLFAKDFLYRRLSSPLWFRVPKEDLHNHLVKLIDFGRNRLLVASEPNHIQVHNDSRHVHDRLLCLRGYEYVGYPCDEPNRQIDLLVTLLNILHLPRAYWEAQGREASQPFFTMCETLIDFFELNDLVRARAADSSAFPNLRAWLRFSDEYAGLGGGGIQAHNFHRCSRIYDFLREPGVFIYRLTGAGATASDLLDDPFFEPYRTERVLPEGPLTDEEVLSVRDSSVVVSFIAHPVEAELLEAAEMELTARVDMKEPGRCAVCHGSRVTHKVGETELLCSYACYEFRYLFGNATVYRPPHYSPAIVKRRGGKEEEIKIY
jgi:hypothetical protein